jgi:hypothetical protein
MKPFAHHIVFVVSLLLAGCQAQGPFPSLAQREVERRPLTEPVRPVPVVANDAVLRDKIADLAARAREADRAFEAAYAAASAAARGAGGAGSDSWIAAQEQLSRVEASRAGTTTALGDLDRLALERSNLPTSPADQAVLASALDEVERLAADQQSRLDRLKGLIAR